jgi:putative ABC transport system permease protein
VSLGIASAFSRPGASLATAAVIAIGLTGAVVAVGLNSQMFQLVVGATTPRNGAVVAGQALVRRLTVLVAVVAALGVLSAVIMLARQRVRDLGVYKAIGAAPRQIVVTVVSWVLAPAIAATLIAVPAGVVVEHVAARETVNGQARELSQSGAPSQRIYTRPNSPGAHPRVIDLPAGASRHGGPGPGPAATQLGLPPAYNPGTLTLLALAGLAVAIAGALGPAVWAVFSRTTTALRAE